MSSAVADAKAALKARDLDAWKKASGRIHNSNVLLDQARREFLADAEKWARRQSKK
jgi:hypothetical protein